MTDEEILAIASQPVTAPLALSWLKDDVQAGSVRASVLRFARALLDAQPSKEVLPSGAVTLAEHINMLHAEYGSLRAVTEETGVDAGYLVRLRDATKSNPSDELLNKLGLKKTVHYYPSRSWG